MNETIAILIKTMYMHQPTIDSITDDDCVAVMEGLIDHLSQFDFSKRPKGFYAAVSLSARSNDAKNLFLKFISSIDYHPIWMIYVLENNNFLIDFKTKRPTDVEPIVISKSSLKYCPQCGSDLIDISSSRETQQDTCIRCDDCDFELVGNANEDVMEKRWNKLKRKPLEEYD